MITKETVKKRLLGLNPYSKEIAELHIRVEDKHMKLCVSMASLYDLKISLSDALKNIIDMHQDEINTMYF